MKSANYLVNIFKIIFFNKKNKLTPRNDIFNNSVSESFNWQRKNIEIKNIKEKIPVSVIIPTIKSRYRFLNDFVIPSLKHNNPQEIIVLDDENLDVQEKRNKGAAQATQEYLFFCDDDTILPKNHLFILYQYLQKYHSYDLAYTDYQAIVMNPKNHPLHGNYYHRAGEFDLRRLRKGNYIDTSSLLRANVFPGFDPNIKRLQDWDLWLTMANTGSKGLYVRETGLIKFYLDEGITSIKNNLEEAKKVIYKKHNL